MISERVVNFYVYLVILTILQRGMAQSTCLKDNAAPSFMQSIEDVSKLF